MNNGGGMDTPFFELIIRAAGDVQDAETGAAEQTDTGDR